MTNLLQLVLGGVHTRNGLSKMSSIADEVLMAVEEKTMTQRDYAGGDDSYKKKILFTDVANKLLKKKKKMQNFSDYTTMLNLFSLTWMYNLKNGHVLSLHTIQLLNSPLNKTLTNATLQMNHLKQSSTSIKCTHIFLKICR